MKKYLFVKILNVRFCATITARTLPQSGLQYCHRDAEIISYTSLSDFVMLRMKGDPSVAGQNVNSFIDFFSVRVLL